MLREARVRTLVFHDSVLEADVDAELGDVEDPLPPSRQATSDAAGNATGNPCASGPPTPARSLTAHCFTGWNSTWPGLRNAKRHQTRC